MARQIINPRGPDLEFLAKTNGTIEEIEVGGGGSGGVTTESLDVGEADTLTSTKAGSTQLLTPTVHGGSAGDEVPVMSNYTNAFGDSVTASTDSQASTGRAWKAFNGDNGSDFNDFWHGVGAFPHWLAFNFGEGRSALVTGFTITNYNYTTQWAPIDFKLQGSNNNTDWTDLKTVVGNTALGQREEHSYTVDYPDVYKHYRLYVTKTSDGNTDVIIAELAFTYGEEGLPNLTLDDSYTKNQSVELINIHNATDISVKSESGQLIKTLTPGLAARFFALTNTPTDATDWFVIE